MYLLGFYTAWLLPAAVVGLLVFLFGLFTIQLNKEAYVSSTLCLCVWLTVCLSLSAMGRHVRIMGDKQWRTEEGVRTPPPLACQNFFERFLFKNGTMARQLLGDSGQAMLSPPVPRRLWRLDPSFLKSWVRHWGQNHQNHDSVANPTHFLQKSCP